MTRQAFYLAVFTTGEMAAFVEQHDAAEWIRRRVRSGGVYDKVHRLEGDLADDGVNIAFEFRGARHNLNLIQRLRYRTVHAAAKFLGQDRGFQWIVGFEDTQDANRYLKAMPHDGYAVICSTTQGVVNEDGTVTFGFEGAEYTMPLFPHELCREGYFALLNDDLDSEGPVIALFLPKGVVYYKNFRFPAPAPQLVHAPRQIEGPAGE